MKKKLSLHVQGFAFGIEVDHVVVEACHLPPFEGKSQNKSNSSIVSSQDELDKDEIICRVDIEKQIKKTAPTTLSKNYSCFWNEGFEFTLSSNTEFVEAKISISWNRWSLFGSKEIIAETKIKLLIAQLMDQLNSLLCQQEAVLASQKSLPVQQTMDDFGNDWYTMEATVSSPNENVVFIQPEIRVKFHLIPHEQQVQNFLDLLEPRIQEICERPISTSRRASTSISSSSFPVPKSPSQILLQDDNDNNKNHSDTIQESSYIADSYNEPKLDSYDPQLVTVKDSKDFINIDNTITPNFQTDFNARFQQIVELVHSFSHDTSIMEKLQANLDLMHLYQDFLHCAKTYAKIIISEGFHLIDECDHVPVYLPVWKKTIKPIDVGGIAGGEKYIVHSILFKFAIDKHGLFGSEESAIKVAGHELSGLISYYNTHIPGLSVPLCCLVDYKGFRVVAESVLPITKNTIIMGSDNGGNTFHNKADSRLCEKLSRACQILNILPHTCRSAEEQLSYGPMDLEIHRGTDGRTYVVDFSRVQPPQGPPRPEFVQQYSKPLNSDAHSGFLQDPDKTESNDAVNEATIFLIEQIIPRFSTQTLISVVTQAQRFGDTEQLFSPDGNLLVDTLHANGINIRHCGLVVNNLLKLLPPNNSNNNSTLSVFRKLIVYDTIILLLVEMIARCIKVYIRSQFRSIMQQFKLPMEQPFRHAAIKILNIVFSFHAKEWWQIHIIPHLESKFSPLSVKNTMDVIDSSVSATFKNPPIPNADALLSERLLNFVNKFHTFRIESKLVLLHRTLNQSGLKLHEHITKLVSAPAFWMKNTKTLFDDHDLHSIGHKVKSMPIMNHARGYLLKSKGVTEGSEWHLEMAVSEFQQSLAMNPNNKLSLRNLAQCMFRLEMLENTQKKLQSLNWKGSSSPPIQELSLYSRRMEKANYLYLRAIAADLTDDETVFQYGHFLIRANKTIEAVVYHLRCLQINPNHTACILSLIHLLARLKRQKYADELQKRLSSKYSIPVNS